MRSMIRRSLDRVRNGRVPRRVSLGDWLGILDGQRSLTGLDDRQLRDIGLTRDQALAAVQRGEPLETRETTAERRSWPMIVPVIAAVALSLMFIPGSNAGGSAGRELPSVADLPPGTVKVSPPVPGMGEHWANPKDLPLGPIYCVMGGKVICAEFMIQHQAFIDGKSFERLRLGMKGTLPPVDHLEVTYMPHGHEGFEVPHYDLHMYFVPPEARFPSQAER